MKLTFVDYQGPVLRQAQPVHPSYNSYSYRRAIAAFSGKLNKINKLGCQVCNTNHRPRVLPKSNKKIPFTIKELGKSWSFRLLGFVFRLNISRK